MTCPTCTAGDCTCTKPPTLNEAMTEVKAACQDVHAASVRLNKAMAALEAAALVERSKGP